MPFDQSSITDVAPPVAYRGQWLLSWTSSAPAGTWFQVYVGRRLAWYGRERSATIAAPAGRVRVDIGAVDADERAVDFAATLPAADGDRVALMWSGGDGEASSYRVYGSPSAGSPVDYTKILATIPAGTPGAPDGFGLNGFGEGPYGDPATYRWTSGALAAGDWTFGVVAVNDAGIESSTVEATETIVAPPLPPARRGDGLRLDYAYDADDFTATLTWLASPSA